jgi:hypothetical protein
MIPGARAYLRKLSDEGYRIRIITHRLFIHYFHGMAVQQTIEWLDQYGIPYWDLCFMKNETITKWGLRACTLAGHGSSSW